MKIAVLGSTGMLGSMLVKYLNQFYEVMAFTHTELDANKTTIFDLERLLATDCDWIINAIGVIPQRSTNRDEMQSVNAEFPGMLSQFASSERRIIQIATDCVYLGDKGNYTEKDKLDAIDTYGRSKIAGEITHPYFHHLRCSIIGPENHGKSLLGWFLNQSPNAKVFGYKNHFWNGITTLHFAKICHGIIKNRIPLGHIQHVVPFDQVTKAELLGYFATYFNRTDITIELINHIQDKNMTLNTEDGEANQRLWEAAGYKYSPTIRQMVEELAEYVK